MNNFCKRNFDLMIKLLCDANKFKQNIKQAGAELCQAQLS